MEHVKNSITAFIVGIFGVNAGNIIAVLFVSMLPIIELRGAIPLGALLDLPWYTTMLCAIVGNLLPIPFILLFLDKVFAFMKKHNILKKLVLKLEEKGNSKTDKIENKEFLGLILFVAIPLPGTGAWTGALIASLLKTNKKKAFIAITIGILIASMIMTIGSYGLVSIF